MSSQVLLSAAFAVLGGGEDAERVKAAVAALSLSPDAQPIGDFISSLMSANSVEFGVVLFVCASIMYLFGRPLAGGYRLAQMCVSGSEPRSRRRSESELCTQAAAIALPTHEKQLARTTGADLRAELPFDLMVKAAPVFAVTYMGALLTLWDLSIAGSTNAWIGPLLIAGAACRLWWIDRRTAHRFAAGISGAFAVLLVVPYFVSPGRAHVPQLVGLQDAFVAEQRLRDVQLRVSQPVERRVAANSLPGSVIAQSLSPGAELHPGDAVRIVVSDGPRVVEVPRLRGLTAEAADRRLREGDLELGEIRPLDAAPTSVVRSQIPEAGISVDRGTTGSRLHERPIARASVAINTKRWISRG